MIELINIQSAIVSRIYEVAPNIEVNSSDIEEGFNRPSFFVDMLDVESKNLMNKFNEKKIEMEVLYFPKDPQRNTVDLLQARDTFNKMFIENPYIAIEEDLIVEVENIDIFEIDKVLHCKFSLYISEEYEKNYEYTMDDLRIKWGGLNGHKQRITKHRYYI